MSQIDLDWYWRISSELQRQFRYYQPGQGFKVEVDSFDHSKVNNLRSRMRVLELLSEIPGTRKIDLYT